MGIFYTFLDLLVNACDRFGWEEFSLEMRDMCLEVGWMYENIYQELNGVEYDLNWWHGVDLDGIHYETDWWATDDKYIFFYKCILYILF